MCFAKSSSGQLNRPAHIPGTLLPAVAGASDCSSTSRTTETDVQSGEQSPTASRPNTTQIQALNATTAAQSLPCSRYTLAATPTPLRALSVSANALPALASLSAAGLPILPTQSSPPLDHLPAVTEDLVLPPWDPMAAHNEETPGLPCQEPAPLLLEKGGEDSIPVGNERRRPGVLALLRGVCRSLMGGRDDKARPREEVTALPVPRLEDDTPLLAWRQEVYVQSRLQDSPQLTIGEARAEFLRRSFEQNIPLIGKSAATCSASSDPVQHASQGNPCLADELLSDLNAEKHTVPSHPLEDLDTMLDDAWFSHLIRDA
ncbi:hypothetical protein WJX75_006920 [Coccomyxa subellipsoidea]|uniref:Uncharacterized protein n=1 Tax=Coccomyxa subellipsoidea TaxID=248742 RepID=A0ABR2YU32_9CHLO